MVTSSTKPKPKPKISGEASLLNLSPLEQLRAGRLPRRLAQLFAGLTLFGVAMGCNVQANVGLDPWSVFHQGISKHVGLSIGAVTVITSIFVLLLWIPIQQWPGLGTVANAAWLGTVMDLTIRVMPVPSTLGPQWMLFTAALLLEGIGGAMYIGSQLGPGPRDGLMTGINRRFGVSVRVARTGVEVSALAVGWLLGGSVGLGTVLFAVLIGPLVHRFLPFFTVNLDASSDESSPRSLSPADPVFAGAEGD